MQVALMVVAGLVSGFTTGPVTLVADGFRFTEGPVWVADKGTLLFSDIPADRIYRADKSVVREPSGESNGLILDLEGRLLAAEHANRRVTRTEEDGTITVIADRFEGKRFNSPNDIAVRSDGLILFTDPPYGLPGGFDGPNAELDFSGVYAVMPGEAPVCLIRDFDRPNGLAFSIDEQTLYVADTTGNHIRAFDIAEDGSLSNDRVFYNLPTPDGMCLDTEGNIYCTAADGVHIISPDGEQVGRIETPQPPANCAFGGEDGKTLFITARTAVYQVATTHPGHFVQPAEESDDNDE